MMKHNNQELKALPKEELLRYYREYKRRWRMEHKADIQAYNVEQYKKFKGSSESKTNNKENLLNTHREQENPLNNTMENIF